MSRQLAAVVNRRRRRNAVRSWLRTPLAMLLLAMAVAALCAMVVDSRAWTLVAVLGGVVLLGVSYPLLSLLAVRGEITFEASRGREGEPLAVSLQVTNHWPLPVWGVLVDSGCLIEPGADRERSLAGLAVLPSGRTSQWRWEFSPELRGRYPLHPPVLASGFPFGFWTARRSLKVADTVIVWPRTVPIPAVDVHVGGSLHNERVGGQRAGRCGDLSGVRPYRHGDSLRRVHWSQTARHDRFIVCERDTPVAPHIQIVVDMGHAAGDKGNESIDQSVRVAASLLSRLVVDGATVELVIDADAPVRIATPTRLPAGLDQLALSLPAERPLHELLNVALCRAFRGELQIVITTEAAAELAAVAIPETTRRRWIMANADKPALASRRFCGPSSCVRSAAQLS